jgi:hypothetical protein
MLLFFPGAIGSFGHSGTVHPQLPFASEIINGSEPVFVKTKAVAQVVAVSGVALQRHLDDGKNASLA